MCKATIDVGDRGGQGALALPNRKVGSPTSVKDTFRGGVNVEFFITYHPRRWMSGSQDYLKMKPANQLVIKALWIGDRFRKFQYL